jgi:hypothetical protein
VATDDVGVRNDVFEYEVVPFAITRGAGGSESDQEWAVLRAALNQRGRIGYRVVAVTEGQEGRAIIMERQIEAAAADSVAARSVAQAAEDITWDASRVQS